MTEVVYEMRAPELISRVPEPKYKKEGMARFLNLVRTMTNDYGVAHIQFNTHNKEMLKDAQRHPEKYPTLMVRVAGYSAYFTRLSAEVQRDIVCRFGGLRDRL